MPSVELYGAVGFATGGWVKRGSVGVWLGCDWSGSLHSDQQLTSTDLLAGSIHLPSSLLLAKAVRFRLGTGILHSIENATQLVHGTLGRSVSTTTASFRGHN